MTAVDWNRLRKCMYCFAETGQACVDKTGAQMVDNTVVHVRAVRNQPHYGRNPRTGGAR